MRKTIKMGNGLSSHGDLDQETIDKYTKETLFTSRQIAMLWQKYNSFFNIRDTPEEIFEQFMTVMNIKHKTVGEVIFRMLDEDGNANIEFDEFVEGLNAFMPQAPFEKKVQMCFRAFDEDGGGTISKDEVRAIINISLTDNPYLSLTEPQMEQLLDDLFDQYDTSKNGELTLDNFQKMVVHAPGIIECFDIDLDQVFE